MSFNPLQNLKAFATSRPPLLVFLICLTTFAITAISLAYFVRRSDLKNPDVTVDWNVIMENLAKLDLCVLHAGSLLKPAAAVARDVSKQEKPADSRTTEISQTVVQPDRSHSISVSVPLSVSLGIRTLPANVTTINGSICKNLLGFTGPNATDEIQVTIKIPWNRSLTHCDELGCGPEKQVCMTFYNLPELPATNKLNKCSQPDASTILSLFTTQGCSPNVYLTEDDVQNSLNRCHGTTIHFNYQSDPKLSLMLTEHDRIVINLHLMYTSYFLLLVVMTLLCYAMVRGRPKTKMLSPEKFRSSKFSHILTACLSKREENCIVGVKMH